MLDIMQVADSIRMQISAEKVTAELNSNKQPKKPHN